MAVSGELGTREHEGKMYLTLRANSVDLVGGKSDSAPASTATPTPSAPKQDDFEDDDIPFSQEAAR